MEVKLDTIIKQLDQVKTAKSSLERTLTQKIEGLEKSCKKLVTKMNVLQNVAEKQKLNSKFLEYQVRRKNIVLYGLRQPVEETPERLREMIYELIDRHLGLKMLRFEFDAIYRIGVKRNDYHKRPVIIKLISEHKKRAIMRRAHLLKKFDLQMKDDFSREIIEKRKLLQPICHRLRQENKGHVVLSQDKIYVNGQLYDTGKEMMEKDEFKMDVESNNFSGVQQQDIEIVAENITSSAIRNNSNDIEILDSSTVHVKIENNPRDVQILDVPPQSKAIEVISL